MSLSLLFVLCCLLQPYVNSDAPWAFHFRQMQDISGIRKWEDLPQKARDYVKRVDELTGVKTVWIGVGPGRDAIIIQP